MIRLVAALALIATPAAAQYAGYQGYQGYQGYRYTPPSYAPPAPPRTTYDWRSGNTYTTTPQSDGSTTVRGWNGQTGAQWNTRIDAQGNQRGTDSNGNMWNYNARSGTYINYGTGRMCTGTGYARVCN